MYADDTELHASDCTAVSAPASVYCDLVNIDKWLSNNYMVPNPHKSLVMKVGSIPALKSTEVADVRLSNQRPKEVTTAKYLGVHVDSALSWNDHLTKLYTVARFTRYYVFSIDCLIFCLMKTCLKSTDKLYYRLLTTGQ